VEPDPVRELERQVEAGSVFAHAVLAAQAGRVDDAEAIVRGLVELLVERGVVDGDELVAAVDAVRTQTDIGVAIRVDGTEMAGTPVDCATRLPICHAVCCRLRFPLSVDEIEAGGPLKWELGRPYFNRHGADGSCHQCDGATHACRIYDERPAPCRQYSCAGDERIWTDFDAMELNQEWIDAHLGAGADEVFMAAGIRSESDPASGPR